MSHHYLHFNSVSFTYPDGTKALSEVSFEMHHGERIGLIGANGAGKSTLLQLLAGFLVAQSGSIDLGGLKITPSTIAEVRRTLGFVFQDADDQLFMPTVFEDVAFGPANLGVEEPELTPLVQETLKRTGIAHLADRPPYHLSGGQKRAAAIATVLASTPSMLVLDEPANALDPMARRRIIEQLKGFSHSQLIASHDLDLVLDLCHRVVVLHEGKVAAVAPPMTVFKDKELLERCGLLPPLRMQQLPPEGPQLKVVEGHHHEAPHHHHTAEN
jgi:cobalt/nickel transport system ATP-binding protein